MPSAGPDHLAVYLSNRCNLACSYCYVSVNEGPAVRLDADALKRSIDRFLGDGSVEGKKITFLGGEPLLNFPVLAEAARHARRRGGSGVVLQTFTNGTLLTPERLRVLEELEVHATISLDGAAATNDRHRAFLGARDRSVFKETMRRLEGLPLGRLGVSLVFTSETVEELLENVELFRSLGFGRITFNPELYEEWPEARLEVLRLVMAGFRRYYGALVRAGRAFTVPILFALIENEGKDAGWWHECHNVVLGPDERFYACDKALSFPIGEAAEQRVGEPRTGMDWEKRGRLLGEAARYIEEKGWGKKESFCPMGVYFHSRQAGRDPQAALENFHRVAEAFGEALEAMIAELRGLPQFDALYGAHDRLGAA